MSAATTPSAILGTLLVGVAALLACCGPGAVDAHDVVQIEGEEIGLDDPDELLRALTIRASELLACERPQLTVESHVYGRLRYWAATGCERAETMALAHRCAPGTGYRCAARIVSISDGDPSPELDPDMRMQSADAIGMASLVTRGSVDLICSPPLVRLDYVEAAAPLTILSGCGRRAGYVFSAGIFQRVPDEMLPPLAPPRTYARPM